MSPPPPSAETRVDAISDLERRLESAAPAERVELLNDLAAKLTASDAPRSREIAEQALTLARELGDAPGEAMALRSLAYATWGCGELDAALSLADEALARFEALGDLVAAARTHLIRSMVYRLQSRVADAADAILTALRLAQEADDRQGAAIALDGLGGLYFEQGDLPKALEYRERCAALHEDVGDEYRLGIAWNNLGETYAKMGDLDSALFQFERALERLREIEPEGYPIAATYHGIGEIHWARGSVDEARASLERALELRRRAGDDHGVVLSCTSLGRLRADTGEAREAETLLRIAIETANRIGLPIEERDALLALSRLGEERGEYREALELRKRASELTDQIVGVEQGRHVAALQARHEAERRERDAEIHELKYVRLREEVEQRRRTEMALVQAQKLESLGVMAGGLAHDFNNMLTTVLGNTELALRLLPGESAARPCLDQAHSAGRRAADLSRLMLAYAGRGNCVLVPCDLGAVIEASRDLLNGLGLGKALLAYELDAELPKIRIDETQVHQILSNLVLNALEAGATKVTIAVRIRELTEEDDAFREFTGDEPPPGPYVALSVEDDGSGLEDADRPRIFDPFFTTKFVGRGLGLAAVLGIVRGHGAGIAVASRPGGGSRFEIAFPVAEEADTGAAASEATSDRPSPADAAPGVALVIEDEESVQRLVTRVLRSAGFEVRSAGDGRSGIELLREDPRAVAVVLLDATMPGMSVAETWEALRSVDPEVPIVITSGLDPESALRSIPEDVVFVPKPYSTVHLVRVLERHRRRPATGTSVAGETRA